MTDTPLFVEMFPVLAAAMPKLTAYQPVGDMPSAFLASRLLEEKAGGRWVWTDGLLITDTPADPKKTVGAESLEKIPRWKPTPTAIAGFLARGLVPLHHTDLAKALEAPLRGNFRVLQEATFRNWTVDDQPALSIGVTQRLIYRQDLAEYAATLRATRGLIGMSVTDKTPAADGRRLVGDISAIDGTVKDHRANLLARAIRPAARAIVDKAPDSEPVVKVKTSRGEVAYATSALYILLRDRDYTKLRVDAAEAKKASYQNIGDRAPAVAAASRVLKAAGYIDDAYNSKNVGKQFLSPGKIGFDAQIRLGDQTPRPYNARGVFGEIRQSGMFSLSTTVAVKLRLINALGEEPPNKFDKQVVARLAEIGIQVEGVQTVITTGLTETEVQNALAPVAPGTVDIGLALLPGKPPNDFSTEKQWQRFVNLKLAVIEKNLPTVCAYEDIMTARDTAQETALTLARMIGNVPFAMGVPLDFTDFVLGLDILRDDTKQSTAMMTVYPNGGEYAGYALNDFKPGTCPIDTDLTNDLFKGNRVLIHVLAPLQTDEQTALEKWAKRRKITVHTVEITTDNHPRIYALDKGISQPPVGSAFRLGADEALVVTSLPSHSQTPTNPVRVKTDGSLPLENALRSVLGYTLLHPASTKPRLPLTLHHTERVRRMLRAGVRPADPRGDILWWL